MIASQLVATVTFFTAFSGVLINTYVVYFIGRVSTLRNSFGQLTAAQATAEAFLLSVFAFYFSPLVFLETEFLKGLANYFSIFLLICYDVCNYCHLLISINRLTAVALPLHYERIFSKTNTTRLIIITWIISVATCIFLYGIVNCHLYYDNEYWRLNFINNTVCNTIVWYGDFVKDFATVIIIILVDTITVCHVAALRIRNSKNKQSKRVNESNLLKQACTQAFAFAIELVSYFILVNYFENRFVKYALTGYAWITLHSIDGLITIYFNKEFRNFKKLRAHYSEKHTSSVVNLTNHP
ncbi:unnamed protein product [Auanema sp. JU1783]|nr:unnamed protein product [Auanema sp. JU1783]